MPTLEISQAKLELVKKQRNIIMLCARTYS